MGNNIDEGDIHVIQLYKNKLQNMSKTLKYEYKSILKVILFILANVSTVLLLITKWNRNRNKLDVGLMFVKTTAWIYHGSSLYISSGLRPPRHSDVKCTLRRAWCQQHPPCPHTLWLRTARLQMLWPQTVCIFLNVYASELCSYCTLKCMLDVCGVCYFYLIIFLHYLWISKLMLYDYQALAKCSNLENSITWKVLNNAVSVSLFNRMRMLNTMICYIGDLGFLFIW